MKKFKVYYGDGSMYDRDPFRAPTTNVQVVVQETNTGVSVMHGKDAYYWNPDFGWNGCDQAGLWDYLLLYQGPKAIIFGRSIRDDDYWKIVDIAIKKGL